MNNSRQWILATAGFLALSLWVGTASADGPVESTTSPSTLDDLDVLNISIGEVDVNAPEMSSGPVTGTTSGDSSAALVANSDPDAIIDENSIGDNSTTGDITVYSGNTGGINVQFANSGNDVVMQNSMAVNIYLGPQQ
jgi:hypothetical protein